ncbi:MAG: T9SS type A sorting domain-containing protein [Chitinispirillaceae bacterium]|nr:T9SS type A sorting domain-containing protein [Chitinispirillaceae bacterium]
MRTAGIAVFITIVIFTQPSFADEQWTGGVSDFISEYGHLEKSLSDSPSFNYSVREYLINGPAGNRVNIGYAGDGYTVRDTGSFPGQAINNINYRRGRSSVANNKMVMRPFPRYDKFFNWYIVNVVSRQSGLSVAPSPRDPKDVVVDNALGGTRDYDRLGWVDNTLALALFKQAAQEIDVDSIHWKYVILNNNAYHNSGSYCGIAVFSYPYWGDIAVHESGHAFHYLTDEYYVSGTDDSEYVEINSTHNRDGSKWGKWIGYRDIDSRTRSGGGNPTGDTVGYYLGSRYVSSGQYRPTSNSKMNMTSQNSPVSFNAVCREKIIRDIYRTVRPVDTLFDTVGQKTNPDSLWVRVIDPAVLRVDWYVGTTLKKPNGGCSILKNEIATMPGTYTVRAHVYDEILRHMNSNNRTPDTLDLVRMDTTGMFQDVEWKVQLVGTHVSFCDIQRDVFRADLHNGTIVYGLGNPTEVSIDIHTIDGSLVKNLRVPGAAGKNTAAIPAVCAGIYIVSLRSAQSFATIKMNIAR